MTAQDREVAQVQAAQAAGERAAAAHQRDTAAMQATIAGSQVWVESPAEPDDVDPGNLGSPARPSIVSPEPASSANVTRPTDNQQSQG